MNNKRASWPNSALAALFLGGAGIIASGSADTALSRLPFLAWGLGVTFVVVIAATLFGPKQVRFVFFRLGPACGLFLLAVCAVHFSSNSALYGYPTSPFFVLYFAVIIFYASLGATVLWITVLVSILLFETGSMFASGYLNVFLSPEWPQLLAQRFSPLRQPLAELILAGLIPYIIARTGSMAPAGEKPGAPEADPMPRGRVGLMPVVAASSETGKTQILLPEQDTRIFNKSGMDDLLSSVVYFMSRNFKAYSALGFVFDTAKNAFVLNAFHSKNHTILSGLEIPIGKGIVGRVGAEKSSFISGDLSMYPGELLYYGAGEPINSVISVPILSDAKELLGALVIDSMEKNSFSEQHRDTLRRFSVLAAALITNMRMRLYQEKAAKSFQIFYEASQQFITALSTAQVFDVLFSMIGLLTPASRMLIVTFNQQTKRGVINRIVGPTQELQEGMEFAINAGLYSYAFTKRTTVNIGNFPSYRGKYYRFLPNEAINPAIQSLIIIPILDDEQRILGLLSIESETPNQFAGETEKYLSTLLGNASVAITRAQLYRKMETLATTDGLTQLNNHRTFQEQLAKELERSRRNKRPLGLLLMDIDHFKSFNDTYGHPVGDLVLKEISACIKRSVRINDIAARYGGEEFAVITPETKCDEAMVIAERIRRTVEQHTICSLNNQLRVTISVGCSVLPVHATAQQSLIDAADKALYFSKEHGRNRTTLFSPEMRGEKK
jgi:diguanylate cyclase (GGDEF)-like protein